MLALAAGCDLLCIGTENTEGQLAEIEHAIASAVAAGRIAPDRVADASARVLSLARDLRPAAASASVESAPVESAPVESAKSDPTDGVSRAKIADSMEGESPRRMWPRRDARST
ncbi:hypothetical protein [Leifsonia xyli]|uniref:hypothetical protein n=1 Tax=Leifsonia xyli TaxID=1575 RepID=UPI003D6658E4